MGRRASWPVTGLVMVLTAGWCAPSAAALELPMPPGSRPLPEQNKVHLGQRNLMVKTVFSDENVGTLIRFYQDALPQSGWVVEPLPWQTMHQAATGQLRQETKYAQFDAFGEKRKEELAELESTEQAMRQQIYATQGGEHVIVNLWEREKGTVIFYNHWVGDRGWMHPQEKVAGQIEPIVNTASIASAPSASASWPKTNACCSQEEVPAAELEEALPFSVPQYPGSRTIASSAPESKTSATMLMISDDSEDQVVSHYHRAMPQEGWVFVGEHRSKMAEGTAETRILTYQRSEQVCEVRIAGGGAEGQASDSETMITVAMSTGR